MRVALGVGDGDELDPGQAAEHPAWCRPIIPRPTTPARSGSLMSGAGPGDGVDGLDDPVEVRVVERRVDGQREALVGRTLVSGRSHVSSKEGSRWMGIG